MIYHLGKSINVFNPNIMKIMYSTKRNQLHRLCLEKKI